MTEVSRLLLDSLAKRCLDLNFWNKESCCCEGGIMVGWEPLGLVPRAYLTWDLALFGSHS